MKSNNLDGTDASEGLKSIDTHKPDNLKKSKYVNNSSESIQNENNSIHSTVSVNTSDINLINLIK